MSILGGYPEILTQAAFSMNSVEIKPTAGLSLLRDYKNCMIWQLAIV